LLKRRIGNVMSEQKKILIVDDQEFNLEFLEGFLSQQYNTERAKNGIEALEKIRRFYPDLILLDIVMPKMTGWEYIRKLKNDSVYKNIPIIVLSAEDDPTNRTEVFILFVNDYILKPINASDLIVKIKAVLEKA
jgi:two-component system sensor histidine kinase ChiS